MLKNCEENGNEREEKGDNGREKFVQRKEEITYIVKINKLRK